MGHTTNINGSAMAKWRNLKNAFFMLLYFGDINGYVVILINDDDV